MAASEVINICTHKHGHYHELPNIFYTRPPCRAHLGNVKCGHKIIKVPIDSGILAVISRQQLPLSGHAFAPLILGRDSRRRASFPLYSVLRLYKERGNRSNGGGNILKLPWTLPMIDQLLTREFYFRYVNPVVRNFSFSLTRTLKESRQSPIILQARELLIQLTLQIFAWG